jgi:rod shape-determining protein MreD
MTPMAVGRREPSPSLLRRAESAARALVPALCVAVLMLLAAGPTGVPFLMMAVTLPQVVFWSIFRPSAMSPPLVFLLGLLLDLLSLAPLGTGVLTLLVAHGLAVLWRRFFLRQGFLAVWFAFLCFAVGAAALGYVLTALLSLSLPPVAPGIHQAVLTTAVYPLFAAALGRLQALMLRAEDSA